MHSVVYAHDDAEEWLDKAEVAGWTVAEFRERVFGVKIRATRFTVDELKERLRAWHEPNLKNNGRRYALAFIESL